MRRKQSIGKIKLHQHSSVGCRAEVGSKKWRTDLQRGASWADTLEGSALPVHFVLHLLSLLSCLCPPSFNLLLHLPLLLLRKKTDVLFSSSGSSGDAHLRAILQRRNHFYFSWCWWELPFNFIGAYVGGVLFFPGPAMPDIAAHANISLVFTKQTTVAAGNRDRHPTIRNAADPDNRYVPLSNWFTYFI